MGKVNQQMLKKHNNYEKNIKNIPLLPLLSAKSLINAVFPEPAGP